jgi:hypothetical protein
MTVLQKARRALDLKKLRLPKSPPVEAIEVEDYTDWSGNDALRVWVILEEDTNVENVSGNDVIQLKEILHDRLIAQGISLFPYVHFVKASERQPHPAGE